ncbi:hypothetical protein KAX17_14175 [Candidatus Bipolaricaulota bacterium]|nr:hypothetical protein [Candidatus Bipolaricaulota bacterium]
MINPQCRNIVRRPSRCDNSALVTLNVLTGSDIEMRVFEKHGRQIPGQIPQSDDPRYAMR